MESVIRNVKDIEPIQRQWIEESIGRHLEDNQQVIIRVVNIDMEPDSAVRDTALEEASAIAAQGRSHAAAERVSEEDVNSAIDEAIQHSRQPQPE